MGMVGMEGKVDTDNNSHQDVVPHIRRVQKLDQLERAIRETLVSLYLVGMDTCTDFD